ncbi:hypothetical protein [Novosphingobium resinovorum]|uniref:hypothetical protein n=1 Tax=Novosphingobium resinovorum TaxID=158500 RepID=UPI002ED51634|nr:hypothetical protein [Novosphingobium resinovorum]
MTLEQVQKLTDIVLKGVVAAGLAVGTFLVTRDQTQMNQSKMCGELLQQNFDYVQANLFTDARKALLDAKLEVQGRICGAPSSKLVDVLNNSWRSPVTAAQAMSGEDAPVPTIPPLVGSGSTGRDNGYSGGAATGSSSTATTRPLEVEANLDRPQWVAVSRRNDTSYSAQNFDVVSGNKDALNTAGNVIRARWFVNIREKNTPVVNGDNAVIGQLLAGQCVRIDKAVEGTLNSWALVVRVACPS